MREHHVIGPTEDVRTRAFVAGLPTTGAVVFVLDRLMQDFTRDLVRATHGIRGCEATSIFVAPTEAAEAPFHIENRRPVFRHPDVVEARGRADAMRAALVGTQASRPAVPSARRTGRTTMMVRDATAGAIIFTHHPAMRDYVRNLVKLIHPPVVAATIDVHVAPSPIDEMRITAGSHRTRHVLRDHALLEERAMNAPLIPRPVPDKPPAQPAPARFSLDTLREWRMPSVSETSHGH